MICVRHRSASGRLDESWEFDAEGLSVAVSLRIGALTCSFEVAVCSYARPRIGAHPIVRLNSESWRIIATRFVLAWPNRVGELVAIPCPINASLTPGDALILTNAPADVDAQLEALAHV